VKSDLVLFLQANWGWLVFNGGLFLTAVFVTMPIPGTRLDGAALYRWFYDAVHQFANLRRPTMPQETAAKQ